MKRLTSFFVAESKGLLETVGESLLLLEKSPDDSETLNSLFRAMHTIKGGSGMFDVGPLTEVVHAAEDVLDAIRQGRVAFTSNMADIFLDSFDQINDWLDAFEKANSLPDSAAGIGKELSEALRALMSDVPDTRDGADRSQTTTRPDPEPNVWLDWLIALSDSSRRDLYCKAKSALRVVRYTPNEQCFFHDIDPLDLVQRIPGLRLLSINTREPCADMAEFDPYRCILDFHAVIESSEEAIRQHFHEVAESFEIEPLSRVSLVFPTGSVGDSGLFAGFVEDARALVTSKKWEDLRVAIQAALELAGPDLIQRSALQWLEAVLNEQEVDTGLVKRLLDVVATGNSFSCGVSRTGGTDPAADEGVCGRDSEIPSYLVDAGAEIMQAQAELLSLPCEPEMRPGRLASVVTVLDRVFRQTGMTELCVRLEEARKASDEKLDFMPVRDLAAEALVTLRFSQAADTGRESIGGQPAETSSTAKSKLHPGSDNKKPAEEAAVPSSIRGRSDDFGTGKKITTLKVDQGKIDTLIDLVGELVVAKNSLPFLAKRAEEVFGAREMSKEIQGQYDVINRIANDLQGAVMQVRMVPVSHIFQRFPRLVRDLSRRLDKRIRLVMEGEETEADKNVAEDLADPLIHLLRNSIDHGIESPAERTSTGKNPEGEIRLSAAQADDHIEIEIRDDGRGIDPEKVKCRAYEKGLLTEDQVETMSDEDAVQLIFHPGFSTVEEVSDLSGRGVGMDVVRTMVTQKGGTLSVDSEKGKGTCIRLSLPLSMAVTHVMMIEVGNGTYGVGIREIVETVRVSSKDIHRIKNRETVVLRDRVIPLSRLDRVLGLNGKAHQTGTNGEVAILVVDVEGQQLGLGVDRFHESVDVILKRMDGCMAKFKIYAGAALLGDGRVLPVLNLKEVAKCL